jgi:hypothetical protein
MTDKSQASFAVVRFNERTYQSGGVIAVIKGTESAERTLNDFDECQGDDNRKGGWRYFLEETDLRSGMDPKKATMLRVGAARSCRKRLRFVKELLPNVRIPPGIVTVISR